MTLEKLLVFGFALLAVAAITFMGTAHLARNTAIIQDSESIIQDDSWNFDSD